MAQQPANQPANNIHPAKTPVARANSASCLSMSLNQSSKRRLSVSPIVSSLGIVNNKFNINTPLPGGANVSSLASAQSNVNQLHSHHHPASSFYHKNFSPMAALSRSPSCSSSPAVFQIGASNANANQYQQFHRRSLAGLPPISALNSSTTTNNNAGNNTTININTSSNLPVNPFMTPSIEMSNFNNCKTPMNNIQQTPLHNQMMNVRCSYTPQMNNASEPYGDSNASLFADQQNQPLSDYLIEVVWSEQSKYLIPLTFINKFIFQISFASFSKLVILL